MPVKNITSPSFGLYLGMSPAQVPSRGMSACLNVRIKQGRVVRDNLGWAPFPLTGDQVNLDDKPVTLIDNFVLRNGTIKTIFGNATDLFEYDDGTGTVAYLTPIYATGTVDVINGDETVEGSGTTWTTNAKAGDFIHFGSATQRDPEALWYEIASITDDDTLELTAPYAGTTDTGLAYTIRQVFTADADDVWDTEYFYGGDDLGAGAGNDRWYATNQVDNVVAWDGALDQVYIPNLGDVDTCKFLRRDNNRMIYGAPTISGSFEKFSIRTSDISKPEDTVNGEAVQLIVHDRTDELIYAAQIGGLLAIYGRRSVTMAQYVSGDLIYAFRSVVTTAGPISLRAVAEFPEYHYFIGDDSQYIFDGTRADYINTHVWRDIARRIVPERTWQLHHTFDYNQGELLWCVPLTTDEGGEEGNVETAYVHHYLEETPSERIPDPHTYRDLPATAMGPYLRPSSLEFDELEFPWEDYNFRWNDKFFFAKYPQILFGDADGNIYILNEIATQDGVDPVSYARFGRTGVSSNPSETATVRRIYPFMEQLPDSVFEVDVVLYTTKLLEGVAALASTLSYNLGQSSMRNFVSPLKPGRYCEVQIGTQTGAHYWACNGYCIDYNRAAKV